MSVNLECILCRTGSGTCSRRSIPEKRNKNRVREELGVWGCQWFGQRRRSLHRAHSDPTHLPLHRGTCHSCSSSAERQQWLGEIKAELPGNGAAKQKGVVAIKNKEKVAVIWAHQCTSALFDLNPCCLLPDRRQNNLPHRWSKLRTGSQGGTGRRPPHLCLLLLPPLHRHPQTHLHIK